MSSDDKGSRYSIPSVTCLNFGHSRAPNKAMLMGGETNDFGKESHPTEGMRRALPARRTRHERREADAAGLSRFVEVESESDNDECPKKKGCRRKKEPKQRYSSQKQRAKVGDEETSIVQEDVVECINEQGHRWKKKASTSNLNKEQALLVDDDDEKENMQEEPVTIHQSNSKDNDKNSTSKPCLLQLTAFSAPVAENMILKELDISRLKEEMVVVKKERDVLKERCNVLQDRLAILELEVPSLQAQSRFEQKRISEEQKAIDRLNLSLLQREKTVNSQLARQEDVERETSALLSKKTKLQQDILKLAKKQANSRKVLAVLSSNVASAKQSALPKKNKKCKIDEFLDTFRNLKAGDNPTDAILHVYARTMPRSMLQSKAYSLVCLIWSDDFLGGLCQPVMIDLVKSHLRKNVFNVQNVLKALDMSGIKCGFTAVDVLRKIDAPGKHERSILPSSSSLSYGCMKVERRGDRKLPFETFTTDEGEGFQFDVDCAVDAGLKFYGVAEIAKLRSISLSLTSDGAALNHRSSHICAGLKWNDAGLQDPFTGKPLLLLDDYGKVKGGLQSRDLTMPLRLEIARDTKETAQRFRKLYDHILSGDIEKKLGVKKFSITCPHDKKAHWTLLDKGGAAKVKHMFCYCCPLQSSNIARENDLPCDSCVRKKQDDDSSWKCYHHPILAEGSNSEVLKRRQEALLGVIGDLKLRSETLKKNGSVMRIGKKSEVIVAGDIYNIDYIPQNQSELVRTNNLITDELHIRNLKMPRSARQRRELLRKHLEAEAIGAELQRQLDFAEQKNEKAFYSVLEAIPCILHLKNRIGLTIMENIVRKGLNRALDGELHYTQQGGRLARAQAYQNYITNIMEESILGTKENRAQWRFPVSEDDATVMGSIKMENARTRATIYDIELLIDAVYGEMSSSGLKLKEAMQHYRKAIEILRQKEEYNLQDLERFQNYVDLWYQEFIKEFGEAICTNYTHDLSSGHVREYMQIYGPLWRFSNEGWEALNAMIKSFYFRRTFRGGLNKGSQKKSRILPIARFCQRRMMWMLGEGEKAFYDKNDPCAGLESPVDNIDNFDDILAEELLRYNEDGDGDEQEGHFCMATEDGPDNVLFDDLFGTI